jgi:hypothetical protein
MRMRNRTRLHLESLEDRCTPSAGPGHEGLPLVPAPHAAGHEQVSLRESQPAAADGAGNVIAAFAREAHGARVLWGEAVVIDGARVVTWALVSPRDNTILAVGATFSEKLAEKMPEPGDGPAGAIASLEFPALVQETTFFNHLEIQPEPDGHVSPPGSNGTVYSVPHYDFHFYSIPEEEVLSIPAQSPPLPPAYAVPADYLPAGPSLAEMGRHSSPRSILSVERLSAVMVLGYLPDGSQMHFLEPMVSQETLLAQQDFTLDVPVLTTFGREMLYPTTFEATFQGNTWSFVFSDFVSVQ